MFTLDEWGRQGHFDIKIVLRIILLCIHCRAYNIIYIIRDY